ncbi:hypothetical protein [Tenggerimyces flavus]|uniref:Uncharacterized protein n=1 Tax=Tenggerimyces flavus TaxID=1708749 RepID=A0ABV7Y714_9ACTN|nr:hypothetical protein [Tenggerimyces flavus]MBM7785038.1 hypothetical protein [Tenggerimyces flavus]
MNDQPAAEGAPADLAAIMRLAPDSPYGELIADDTSRRRTLYELLAESDDPLWKEIGTQLRDGQLGPRGIFEVEAYRTHVVDTIAKLGGDFPALLAKTREELEADHAD